jgi:hypothetical protein
VLSLDPLGNVLCGCMGDLVPEHGRKPCVVSSHGEDAGEDDDLAARQAVGVGLVLPKQRHLPDEGRLVARGNSLDALGHTLYLEIRGAGRDDSRPVLTERLRVLLASKLHLLPVGEADMLDTVGYWRLLAVGAEQQNPNHQPSDHERDQRPPEKEPDYTFPKGAHPPDRRLLATWDEA